MSEHDKRLWHIEMFGGMRLLAPGATAEDAITRFPTRKAGALLAYLAYHPREDHSRDALADALWPDADPHLGRGNLRVSLRRLRRCFEEHGLQAEDVLAADKIGVSLKPQRVVTDVGHFETHLQSAAGASTMGNRTAHLCSAVDIYRGELLRGYNETWIAPEARRLEGLFFEAVRELLALLEESEEMEQALHYAYHAVSVEPLREESHLDLIRLYAAQGQTDAARSHYERLSKLLRKHQGRGPAEATRAFVLPLLKPQSQRRRGKTAPPASAPQPYPPPFTLPTAEKASSFVLPESVLTTARVTTPNGRHKEHLNSRTNGSAGRTSGSPAQPAVTLSPDYGSLPRSTKRSAWVGGSVTFLLIDNLHSGGQSASLELARGGLHQGDDDQTAGQRAQLRELIVRHGGHEVGALRSGSLWAIFRAANDALACALAVRRLAHGEDSTPRLAAFCGAARIALDTSDGGLWTSRENQRDIAVELVEAGIKRAALDRALSVLQAGHAGQTLCSEVTGALLRRELGHGVALDDLGIYRLHDAPVPERLYQISYAGMTTRTFPTLLAPPLHSGQLPVPLTTFFGRERELEQIVSWLDPGATEAQNEGSGRLVTLTGFGGCGKTRLSLEAAARLRSAYRRAVWFVNLSGVRDPRLIIHSIVDALRLPGAPGLDPWFQAANELGDIPSLLVLDNFEQLHNGGVEVVQRLLYVAPKLSCLLTSRQSLGLSGERELPVTPLPLPPLLPLDPLSQADQGRIRAQISGATSVRLFVDRARLARPDFELAPRYTESVAQLCALLEGVPLAIELVASHVRTLSPPQLLSVLGIRITQPLADSELAATLPTRYDFQRLNYFHDDRAETPERHRSLRSTIEWSYELLSPELRDFFIRLSVFQGGWTPEAAQAIAVSSSATESEVPEAFGDNLEDEFLSGQALDHLMQLQDRSLMVAEEQGTEMRFTMLEMLRQFGAAQLGEDRRAELEARHAAYFADLAERAASELMDAGRDAWLRRLDPEVDNLRAALAWALRHAPRQCLQMAGALWRFWEARGYFAEGRDWLDRALLACQSDETLSGQSGDRRRRGRRRSDVEMSHSDDDTRDVAQDVAQNEDRDGLDAQAEDIDATFSRLPLPLPLYLRALNGAGRLAWYRADFPAARRLLGECLSLVRSQDGELNNLESGPDSRRGIANALHSLGLVAMCQGDATARGMLQEGLDLVRASGDTRAIKDFMLGLALVKYYMADNDVRELIDEALDISRALNDQRGVAFALNNLGFVEYQAGDYALARDYHERSLPLLREMGDKWSTARAVAGLGRVAWQQGDITAARAYYRENILTLRDLGSRWELVYALEGFAWLALYDNNPHRAARLLGASDSLREATGHVLFPVARPCYEECVAETRSALSLSGEAEIMEILWRRGRQLSREDAILEALGKYI